MNLFETYQPHARQIDFHKSNARFKAINAGRRGGKTYAAGREFIRRIMLDYMRWVKAGGTWEMPETLDAEVKGSLEYWCVAPTYVLGAFQKQEVFEAIGGQRSPLVLRWQRNEGRLWLKGGIKIEFKTGEHPNKLVGPGLNGLWLDEAARIKPAAWRDNLRPTLSNREGWALFSTTPMGRNWFFDDVWVRTALGEPEERNVLYDGFHWGTIDNTSVPVLVAEAEAARLEMSDALWRRNYAADFDAFDGKIYAEFMNNETHVYDGEDPEFVKIVGGKDWGFGNPGCLLIAGIDADGDIWVTEEHYHAEKILTPVEGVTSWIDIMKRERDEYGLETIYGDPADPGKIQTCRQHGLTMRAANNAVLEGIDAVATALAPVTRNGQRTARLHIHRSCANLRRELSSYQWASDLQKPVKKNDHSVDALRYLIMGILQGQDMPQIPWREAFNGHHPRSSKRGHGRGKARW